MSEVRHRPPLGPYSKPLVVTGGGGVVMSEVPLCIIPWGATECQKQDHSEIRE